MTLSWQWGWWSQVRWNRATSKEKPLVCHDKRIKESQWESKWKRHLEKTLQEAFQQPFISKTGCFLSSYLNPPICGWEASLCVCARCIMMTIKDAPHETMAAFQQTFILHLIIIQILLHWTETHLRSKERRLLVLSWSQRLNFITGFKTFPPLSSPVVSKYPC